MERFENIFMGLCVFGSGVLVVFILAKYNYLIKKTILEKGDSLPENKVSYRDIGCIVLGTGGGLGISAVFTELNLSEDTTDLLVYSVILIGGGIGLLTAHFLRSKDEKRG